MTLAAEIGRQLDYQRRLSRNLGAWHALRCRSAMLGRRVGLHDGKVIRLHPPNLMHPISLRIASTDPDVYQQVLLEEEYAAVAQEPAAHVVDCGANVGYTSAWLLSRYPDAQVIAIEPFPENAEMCRRNLAPYGSRATVIEAAVWNAPTRLVLDHAGGNQWGVRVREAHPGEAGDIQAVDIPSLGLSRIDILKVDIERSEEALFARNTEHWLPSVSNIAIELHDLACEQAFDAAMTDYSCTRSRSGELTICRGVRPAA